MAGQREHGDGELTGEALVKETCRRIRLARKHWDAHENGACRSERERAIALYERLSKEEKDGVPQVLRVWLRYRSERYFGPDRTPPGGSPRGTAPRKDKPGKNGPGKSVRRGA